MTDTSQIESPPHAALYVTDAELIRRLGVPEKIARDALRMLDADKMKGFPQKSRLWGGRRYWPAVKAWFDREEGNKIGSSVTKLKVAS